MIVGTRPSRTFSGQHSLVPVRCTQIERGFGHEPLTIYLQGVLLLITYLPFFPRPKHLTGFRGLEGSYFQLKRRFPPDTPVTRSSFPGPTSRQDLNGSLRPRTSGPGGPWVDKYRSTRILGRDLPTPLWSVVLGSNRCGMTQVGRGIPVYVSPLGPVGPTRRESRSRGGGYEVNVD